MLITVIFPFSIKKEVATYSEKLFIDLFTAAQTERSNSLTAFIKSRK